MLIYCQHKSNRIQYTFKVLFEYASKCAYRYTSDPIEYEEYQGPKINYSDTAYHGGVHLIPSEFILSDEIKDVNIRHTEYKGHTIIFTHTDKSDLPYDPISASFYMLSRYEEYLDFKADKHGRYPLKANLSYQLGFHQKPIVHYWLNDLIEAIRSSFPPFSFEKTTYADLPHKFEAGTPNIEGGIVLGTAIDYMNAIGFDNIATYEHELLLYGTKRLQEIEGLTIYGTSENKASVISFNLEGIHPYDIGTIIDKLGIAERTGHHCAQPIMNFYNIPGTIRASSAFYNTKEEIDIFVEAVIKAQMMLS